MNGAMKVLLTFIGSLAIALGLCLALYEVVAIFAGGQTLSDLARAWIRANTFLTLIVVFVLGALLGHLVAWQ